MAEVNAFQNIPFLPLERQADDTRHGAHFFRNVKQLAVGFGSEVFRVDRDGMWAGAETFTDAPWKVDWQGNMTANSVSLSGYIPTGGALGDIGTGNITGTYIQDGAIVSNKIAANAITADKVQANAIDGMTITGALIRTSSSGGRVELDDATDTMIIYDSGGNKRAETTLRGFELYDDNEVSVGEIYAQPAISGGNFFLQAANRNIIVVTSGNQASLQTPNYGIEVNDTTNSVRVNGDLNPYNNAAHSLGSSSVAWDNIYLAGDLIPTGSFQDLGSSTQEFDHLYIRDIYNSSNVNVLDVDESPAPQWNVPMGLDVRSSTPGAASSYEGYMYFDTSQSGGTIVFSDGSGWFAVQASAI